MAKKVWAWLVPLIIVIIILAIVIPLSMKPTAPTTKEPIKIGAVLGLTGPMAGLGEQFKNGALLAVEEINKQGA